MRRFRLEFPLISLILFISLSAIVTGQTTTKNAPPTKTSASTSRLSPEEIINRFTEKESELRDVWRDYAYKQETKLQELGPAKTLSGEFYQVSEFVFNDAGKRIEHILRAPQPTLSRISMSSEDRNALVNLQPFALTKEELPNYKVSYVGKEKIDDLNTYVFDVVPKAVADPRELKRLRDQKIEGKFFQGRIWVDDQDLQIVKTAGKVVPEFKQRFPKFETYRENIDGKHWFPTYTYGEDELDFGDNGGAVPVRLVVRYKEYRLFSGDVKVLDVPAEEVKEESQKSGPNKPGSTGGKASDKKPAAPPPHSLN